MKHNTLSYTVTLQINGEPVKIRKHEYLPTALAVNRRIKKLINQNKLNKLISGSQIIYSDFTEMILYKEHISL